MAHLIFVKMRPPLYLHLTTSKMWCWFGGRGILKKKLPLCYSAVYYYNGAQWYEQFLQVGRLYRALILLGLALLSSERLCIFSLHNETFLLTSFSLPFSELSLMGLALDVV